MMGLGGLRDITWRILIRKSMVNIILTFVNKSIAFVFFSFLRTDSMGCHMDRFSRAISVSSYLTACSIQEVEISRSRFVNILCLTSSDAI